MIIAAAFALGFLLALLWSNVGLAQARELDLRRLEAVIARVEALAHEQAIDPVPGPEPGPLTTDTMEPEDAAVVKQRNRRGYFA